MSQQEDINKVYNYLQKVKITIDTNLKKYNGYCTIKITYDEVKTITKSLGEEEMKLPEQPKDIFHEVVNGKEDDLESLKADLEK